MARTHVTEMPEDDYRRVIDKLEGVIQDTQQLIERFEATGMDEKMQEDYDRLLAIQDRAIKDQTFYTRAMLDLSPD
ncbi:hypothetical protein [Onishia taeanensis]